MIELRHLRTLIALKESGSLAGAAKKRFVTISALSHQIKDLETRIDAPVFVRKSHPLIFTAEGCELLKLAQHVLPQVIETESRLNKGLAADTNRLNVAIECHTCVRWLLPVMALFRQQDPSVELNLSSEFRFEALPALEENKLDLVLTSDPMEAHNLTYQFIFNYEMILVVAKTHPLANKAFIRPEDLQHETLITYPVHLSRLDVYRYFMHPQGIAPKQIKQCDLTTVLFQKIACQEGVAVLPSWSINEAQGLSLVKVKLGKNGLIRPLYGAYISNTNDKPIIQTLIQLIKTQEQVKR